LKNSVSSPKVSPTLHQRSNGTFNLSEVLSRLVYGSTMNSTADDSTDKSDELLVVLEKIAKAGQELQIELQVLLYNV